MADTLVYHRAKTFECEYYTNDFEAAFNHFKLQAVFYSHILYLYYIKLYFIFYIIFISQHLIAFSTDMLPKLLIEIFQEIYEISCIFSTNIVGYISNTDSGLQKCPTSALKVCTIIRETPSIFNPVQISQNMKENRKLNFVSLLQAIYNTNYITFIK